MIPNLPIYILLVFGITTLATLLFFYEIIRAANRESVRKLAIPILVGLVGWLLIQAVLTLNGVYNSQPLSGPPKIVLLGILPALIAVV
jgi:hypothetical protein